MASYIQDWYNSWPFPADNATYKYRSFPIENLVQFVLSHLSSITVLDMKMTGQLLFTLSQTSPMPEFYPTDLLVHFYVRIPDAVIILKVNWKKPSGYGSMFGGPKPSATDAFTLEDTSTVALSDTMASTFMNSFRRYDGFFTDGYGFMINTGGPMVIAHMKSAPEYITNNIRLRYKEYCDDVVTYIQTLTTHDQIKQTTVTATVSKKTKSVVVEEESKIPLPKKTTSKKATVENPDIPEAAKRKPLTKKLRSVVWNTYIGEEHGVAKCTCCQQIDIRQMSFHCAHVIAVSRGGLDTIDNLRPVCESCNKSMGTRNMDTFMTEHGFGPMSTRT